MKQSSSDITVFHNLFLSAVISMLGICITFLLSFLTAFIFNNLLSTDSFLLIKVSAAVQLLLSSFIAGKIFASLSDRCLLICGLFISLFSGLFLLLLSLLCSHIGLSWGWYAIELPVIVFGSFWGSLTHVSRRT